VEVVAAAASAPSAPARRRRQGIAYALIAAALVTTLH